jgi:hypothetical protein
MVQDMWVCGRKERMTGEHVQSDSSVRTLIFGVVLFSFSPEASSSQKYYLRCIYLPCCTNDTDTFFAPAPTPELRDGLRVSPPGRYHERYLVSLACRFRIRR